MKGNTRTARLLIVLAITAGALVLARTALIVRMQRPDLAPMKTAERLAGQWFGLVDSMKREAGIAGDLPPGIPNRGMLGDEWSEITTTSGSIEAKRTAANPRFAALMVRLFTDAGIDSSATIGIIQSGSFPSLAVASLAAVQTLGARSVVISSLGASSYGANQPGATWLDMEECLAKRGGLRHRSTMVTMGGEEDNGGGLSEEGERLLRTTAGRYGVALAQPASYGEAVAVRMALLTSAHIGLLVNIGGNQTSLGMCVHGPALPTGYSSRLPECDHPARGIIERVSERGIPVIHLLNIRSLAMRYGLPLSPGYGEEQPGEEIFETRTVARGPLVALIVCIVIGMFLLRVRTS